MSRAAGQARVWWWGVLPLTLMAWTAANLWWLSQRRAGGPVNIDEAGYLAMAVGDVLAWRSGGVAGWWDSVTAVGTQAPLTPALASAVFLAVGVDPELGYLVVVVSGAAALAVTAALAAQTRSGATVVLSVLLVATTPGILRFSRLFLFALPATFVTTAALYALVRSRRLEHVGWSVAFGVLVGLMPMTRTMALAFVPGLAIAALVQVLVGDGRVRRLRGAGTAALAALALSLLWLIPSRELVFGYLRGFGYGAQSAEYAGTGSSVRILIGSLVNESHLHLVLVAAGWVAAAVVAVRALGRTEPGERALRVVGSPLFPCVVLVLAGCGAILSTRNTGSGFPLPILPAGAVVGAWGIARTIARLRRTSERMAGWAIVGGVALAAVLGSFVPETGFGEPRFVRVPVLGRYLVSDGAGLDPAYYQEQSATFRSPPAFDPGWSAANRDLAAELLAEGPSRPHAAFGFRGTFVNVNTVQLAALVGEGRGIPLVQIDPAADRDEEDYEAWLVDGAARDVCRLVTSSGEVNEFEPLVDTSALERAAAQLGFEPASSVSLPDGRSAVVWARAGAGC